MKRIGLCTLLFSLVSVVPLLAQTSLTSLRGTVSDQSGAVIPGAQVTIKNQATGTADAHAADASGGYTFAQIAPGTYLISVSASGFGDTSKVATLLVNQPATVSLSRSTSMAVTLHLARLRNRAGPRRQEMPDRK